jgi:hypothetical protein
VDTPSPDGVQLLFVQFDIIVLFERQLLYSYYRICLNAKGTKGILTVIKLLACTSRHKPSTKVNTWSTTVVFPGFVHIIRKFKCAALRGRWCAAKTYLIFTKKLSGFLLIKISNMCILSRGLRLSRFRSNLKNLMGAEPAEFSRKSFQPVSIL